MKLVRRAEWGARDSVVAATALSTGLVTIHWEGPHMGTPADSDCPAIVRGIQAYHIDHQGWNDIAYNLLVCPHGRVFEGRGKGVRSAANGDYDSNTASFAICFIGGTGDPFTAAAKDGINDAAEYLVPSGPGWRRHRDWVTTDCPGDVIASWVSNGHPRSTPHQEDDMFSDQDRKTLAEIDEVLNNTEVGVLRRVADITKALQDVFVTFNEVKAQLDRIEKKRA